MPDQIQLIDEKQLHMLREARDLMKEMDCISKSIAQNTKEMAGGLEQMFTYCEKIETITPETV